MIAPLAPLTAQQPDRGRIVGRVVEAEQGSPIAGAQLEVVGLDITAVAAVDGRYALQAVPAGPVSIRVRMIGFAPKVVTGVIVPAAGTIAQDIALAASAVQLAEISVSAEAERGTVNRALDEQRNATNIVSSVSAEQIARSPDSDAGQAVQRVSGVTVQEGKYVFVRGLGERYTTMSLNGTRMPSPDPERKVVPFDLFPSSLLEGITTSKTFTPDQPGDFSGAAVNVKTREFPTQRILTFSSLYYPTNAQSLPPYELEPGLMWYMLLQRSDRGIRRALARYGGRKLELLSYDCGANVSREGANTIAGPCIMRLRDERGQALSIQLLSQLIERGGRSKVLSYANRL